MTKCNVHSGSVPKFQRSYSIHKMAHSMLWENEREEDEKEKRKRQCVFVCHACNSFLV